MSAEIQLPEKCHRCAKLNGSTAFKNCDFCRKSDFPESILCDLNRSVQGAKDFSCYAFLPILKLATPSILKPKKSESFRRPERSQRAEDYQKTIFSETFKYEKALAIQKLNRDPDFVSLNIKFHFAWNVVQRRPLFSPENKYFEFLYDTILLCSDLTGGFSSLIRLAPDHIHVYVESDGEQSPETLLKRMKKFSGKEIMEEFFDLRDEIGPEMDLWDEAYFVETVG